MFHKELVKMANGQNNNMNEDMRPSYVRMELQAIGLGYAHLAGIQRMNRDESSEN